MSFESKSNSDKESKYFDGEISEDDLSEHKKADLPDSRRYRAVHPSKPKSVKKAKNPSTGWVPPIDNTAEDFFSGARSYSVDGVEDDVSSNAKSENWPERTKSVETQPPKNNIRPSSPSGSVSMPTPGLQPPIYRDPLGPIDNFETQDDEIAPLLEDLSKSNNAPTLPTKPPPPQTANVSRPDPPAVPALLIDRGAPEPVNSGFIPVPDGTTQLRIQSDPGYDSQYLNQEIPYDDDLDSDPYYSPNLSSSYRGIIEWIVVIVCAVLLAFLIRQFLIQAFWIPSPSMNDTLVEGDRILVNKINYRFSEIERTDVIVFRNPNPDDENKELVKRVIGLPGETVELVNGEVFIDGESLGDEFYVPDDVAANTNYSLANYPETEVPEGTYFMLGDNRSNSQDSRTTQVGFIDEELVVGKAFVKFWPPSRMGRLE